jgi:hypothetical protein
MNLLLVTYSFPPAAGVGVLRAFSLAKYLPGNRVRVDVLTARNAAAVGQDKGQLAQLPPTVTVHRTWTLDLPFGLRKAIKKAISRPTPAAAVSNLSAPVVGGWKPVLKRLIGNLLLPDPQVGWLPFALPAARRLIGSRSIDAVLVTVPPFSSVRLVTALHKRFPALPIVLDFRDEWLTTTLHLVSFNSNERARKVAEKAESEAVHAAALVVCVTDAAVGELRQRYPLLPPEHFACIPNGFDTSIQAPKVSRIKSDAPVFLTYIGTVYDSTDPATVVEAILMLPPEIRQRLRLRFIGHVETERHRQTLNRLGDQVEFIGFLPQAEALAYMQSTDYLLLITHDPINVAAKLYDYIASGVPILAAVHPYGDVRRVLERTRTGRAADIGDPAAIRLMLTDALATEGTTNNPDHETIKSFQRTELTARYASLLKALLPGETV